MSTVNLNIDNRQLEVKAGATILEAARSVGIKTPTLCAWTEIKQTPGACRVCMTEVEGQRSFVATCVFAVSEGMVVHTNKEKVQKHRQSHENESVKYLYDKFLKEPLGHKSHKLLHTKYVQRDTDLPHRRDE